MSTTGHENEVVRVSGLKATMRKGGNLGIFNKGTCSTAAATADKEVTVGDGFSLVNDAMILVTFQNAVSAADATLRVNSAVDDQDEPIRKPIRYRGAALASGMVKAGDAVMMRYHTDGSDSANDCWNIIGTLDSDTTYPAGTAQLLANGVNTDQRVWQAKIIADFVKDNGNNLLELTALSHDYTFKKRDCLFVGGALYRCTADSTTKPPFNFVFDANNSIVVDRINGQDAVVCDSDTLNTGWEKVLDLTDRYYLENRVKNHFDIITDTNVAVLGNGYGVCETDATTAAKVVSIGNFILKTNGIVSVRFTKTIDVADATLNVSGTGAKTIRINGSNIQPGAVRAGNTVMLQYDGTYWNVVSIQGLEQSGGDTYFWVDLGLPSGLKWAKKNILAEGVDGFAFDEFTYYCSYFSWGNTEGHAPSEDAFTYDFGTSNSGPYASTPGSKLTGNIPPSMDAARMICGAPWRMPTSAEFQELFDNCVFVQADGTTEIPASTTNKLVTKNDTVGIYLKSKKNGNTIFFPCCGRGDGTSLNDKGSVGFYWSGSLYSAADGLLLSFSSTGISPQNHGGRYTGFVVRPVF